MTSKRKLRARVKALKLWANDYKESRDYWRAAYFANVFDQSVEQWALRVACVLLGIGIAIFAGFV